jgi:hypothetical protein
VVAPFYEDDVRHLGKNFHFELEDMLLMRAASGNFDRSTLRPDAVVGDIGGNPLSIAVVIGAFAALSKQTDYLCVFLVRCTHTARCSVNDERALAGTRQPVGGYQRQRDQCSVQPGRTFPSGTHLEARRRGVSNGRRGATG